ncbi:peptide deformylase [candidate division KSB1 bacterium]|nr:MAG: peptide deformylase [candidate division KSB1 bacterium]
MDYQPKSLPIITYGHPTLRVKCERVTEFNEELARFAADMFRTLHDNDGVGLAASQVDRRIQLLVVGVPQKDTEELLHIVVINPEILETRGSWDYEEGCLSVPELRDVVTRPEWIKLKYQDLSGKEHVLEADKLLARVLQHEIDHLNGVLFVDHLSVVRRALMNGKLKQLERENAKVCM